MIVIAVTDPDAAPHRRAAMIVVEKGTLGMRIVRNVPAMSHPLPASGTRRRAASEVTQRSCSKIAAYRSIA